MTAMFPDSGSPASDARNSLPDPNTMNCSELWYSTSRCQPRFDPAAANAVLSELLNVINGAGMPYDCNFQNNLITAIQRLSQCGNMYFTVMSVGPSTYTGTFVPVLKAYCEGMLVKGIPLLNNSGTASLNIDGVGAVTILRNDGTPLVKDDLVAGVPVLMIYHAGNFWIPYFVASQVPHILIGSVDGWVRTDGNDETGDGTANSPAKAFRTIKRAFEVNCAKYVITSQFTLTIRLGIPGTYEGAWFDQFVGRLYVFGDASQPANYRISSFTYGSPGGLESRNFFIGNGTQCQLTGMTFLLDRPTGYRHWCVVGTGSGGTTLLNCRFEALNSNTNSSFIVVSAAHVMGIGDCAFIGNGATVANIFNLQAGGIMIGAPSGSLTFQNIVSSVSFSFTSLSQFSYSGQVVTSTACTGKKFTVDSNSVAFFGTQTVPGDVAGTFSTGGQVQGGTALVAEMVTTEGQITTQDVSAQDEGVPTSNAWEALRGYWPFKEAPPPEPVAQP